MMKRMGKIWAVLPALALLLALLPTAAFADAGIQAGAPALTVNATVRTIGFAGQEWYVIGYDGAGVYAGGTDSVTLLLKGSGIPNPYGDSVHRAMLENDPGDGSMTYYPPAYKYYANNPGGAPWTNPSEYRGSTLQQLMETIAEALPAKERALINARTLTSNNEIHEPMTGGDVADQKLWPLSSDEWYAINNNTIRSFGSHFWLRSALGALAVVGSANGSVDLADSVSNPRGVRPALNLDISGVLFTSDAVGGKASAAAGSGFIGAEAPAGGVKLTVPNPDNQALDIIATAAQSGQSGTTLDFSYEHAATGTNQYVSAVLTDNNDHDALKYYAKLADSSGSGSGALSIPLSGVANGTYTLKIFSEQANGDNYTDFAGTPVSMTLTVNGGTGTVSEFGGTVLSDNAELVSVAGISVLPVGTGTAGSPKTAGITVASGQASITAADLVTSDTNAAVTLYPGGFANAPGVSQALNEGTNEVYIKVTAEDGT
ncbi:MAG: DUF6273 domain-containing protein, partial [Oscillospiraceae bacterium]|nr:DUF6273 domain-containing protein [Oscillospiraceae bacterium]